MVVKFVPSYTVVRPEIQYVDANIAYRFADASQEMNIMLGFTTLFLGSAISFIVSWFTSSDSKDIILYGTAAIFCVISTIIFIVLTILAAMRASEIKRKLFDRNRIVRETNEAST